nr:hypothetical protein [Phenylobacterium sp. J367]
MRLGCFSTRAAFAAKIREWPKTLRKFNVAVVFATQSLADVARSSIAPALIESCPTRIFLPNPDAQTPQIAALYQDFGLNPQQVRIIATATPKREYYYQSTSGEPALRAGLGWFVPRGRGFVLARRSTTHQPASRRP